MQQFLLFIALIFMPIPSSNPITIFDFKNSSEPEKWYIVNDDVMGGVSTSKIKINKEGHAVFSGRVSTANNGGFASVRYRFDPISTIGCAKILLRVKGDEKPYQLRVKSSASDYYSYVCSFETSKDWELIEVNLKDMYPSFRGMKLPMGNFDETSIEELSILIGNKKDESFELFIDHIKLGT